MNKILNKITMICRNNPIISAIIAGLILYVLVNLIIIPFSNRVALEIFYDGKSVSGTTITISEDNRFTIPLQKFFIKNVSNKQIKDASIKIYFSEELKRCTEMWETQTTHGWSIGNSFLEGYVSLLEFNEKISLDPEESWARRYLLVFNFDKRATEIKSISAKLSVYYGVDKPLEVDLLILRPARKNK